MVEEVEQHWDCLIIGAGISGLDAAYHLKVCKIRMRETKEVIVVNFHLLVNILWGTKS